MKKSFTTLFLLSICAIFSYGQEANEPVIDNDMKLQFTAPDGWQVTKKDKNYVMGSENTNGFMLLMAQEFKSQKKLMAAMEDGIVQEDGTKLMPKGELSNLGDRGVSGIYSGKLDDVEMTGFMMALMAPDGEQTAICLSVAPSNVFNQSNLDQLKLLMRSVVFLSDK